jgi:hypothetical protein
MKLVKDYEVEIELKQNINDNVQLRLGLDEGKVPSSPLLLILSGDVIHEYHFS